MKAIVASGAVPLVLLLACLRCLAQPANGAEAERTIDWDSVKAGDPIPETMPTAQSDDPLKAGFAIQWIQRALSPYPFSHVALAIAAQNRAPDDAWANGMEKELRALVHARFEARQPTLSRVFCNDVGCLCYLEREGLSLDDEPPIYKYLAGDSGRRFGLTEGDLWATRRHPLVRGHKVTWEITVVSHNRSAANVPPISADGSLP